MFQVELRFERSMINFEGQEPPIRYYPIAEVVAGHLVFSHYRHPVNQGAERSRLQTAHPSYGDKGLDCHRNPRTKFI